MASNNIVWFIFLPLVACYPPYKAPVPDVDHLHHQADDYAHRYSEKRPDVIVVVREKPEDIHDPYLKPPHSSIAKGEDVHHGQYARIPYSDGARVEDLVHHDPYAKGPYSVQGQEQYKPHGPVYVAKGDLSSKERTILDHVLGSDYVKGKDVHDGPKGYYGPHDVGSYGFGGFDDDDDDDDDDFGSYPYPFDVDDYRRR